MARLARWCFRHRYVVILAWIVALVTLGGINTAAGNGYNDSFSLPGTDSSKALDLLKKSFPGQSGDADTIVWRVSSGSVRDADVRQRVAPMLDRVGHASHVVGVTSPYDPAGAAQISKDGRTAYATVTFDGQAQDLPKPAVKHVVDLSTTARADGLKVEMGGNAVAQALEKPPGGTEAVGIVVAAIVLFIAFGSLLATLLPLAAAIFALGSGLSLAGLLAHVIDIPTFSPTLGALIGLGVGVDYALFIVTRHRNGLKAGRTPEEAVVTAMNTSGRAVLFAGSTVCVALLGLLVLGVDFLNGLALASVLTVLCTVATATTLLPALLRVIGMRALSRRERRRLANEGAHEDHAEGFWLRWAQAVHRRPAIFAGVATLLMLALATPFLSLRLGSSDQGNDPKSTTTRQAYDMLADGFGPGFNGPLQIVAQLPKDAAARQADHQVLDSLRGTVRGMHGVASANPPIYSPDGSVGIIQVVPTTSPQDKHTSDLIKELRHETIPTATRDSGMTMHVGGVTAIFDDFAGVLRGKLPLFIAVIVALGCLLLLVAFRSLVIPLTAAVMNLLAAAASFGLVTVLFQWGWGGDALGLGKPGPVEAFLPVMMMAILFGLSMDYQVFLVSRMHEEWSRSRENTRSVTLGQASTGRVITAAATIMIFVFGAFVLDGRRVVEEFGIGLAGAVLLDAFILRTALVPALMHLMGRRNWYLPRWLDRILPHLSVDPSDEPATAAVAQPDPDEPREFAVTGGRR